MFAAVAVRPRTVVRHVVLLSEVVNIVSKCDGALASCINMGLAAWSLSRECYLALVVLPIEIRIELECLGKKDKIMRRWGNKMVSTTVRPRVFVLPTVYCDDARDNVDLRTGKNPLLSSFSLLST